MPPSLSGPKYDISQTANAVESPKVFATAGLIFTGYARLRPHVAYSETDWLTLCCVADEELQLAPHGYPREQLYRLFEKLGI